MGVSWSVFNRLISKLLDNNPVRKALVADVLEQVANGIVW
jgi:hypothetical protein